MELHHPSVPIQQQLDETLQGFYLLVSGSVLPALLMNLYRQGFEDFYRQPLKRSLIAVSLNLVGSLSEPGIAKISGDVPQPVSQIFMPKAIYLVESLVESVVRHFFGILMIFQQLQGIIEN